MRDVHAWRACTRTSRRREIVATVSDIRLCLQSAGLQKFRHDLLILLPLTNTPCSSTFGNQRGLGVYVGNNPERFIGDVRWAKNHSALERSSCSCELFAIRNCFPLIVRRTRTYARTSRFTTFHLSFPFTYLTNLSAIRRIPSRSIIHLYVQKTKQSIGRSFISDLSFSGFGCI